MTAEAEGSGAWTPRKSLHLSIPETESFDTGLQPATCRVRPNHELEAVEVEIVGVASPMVFGLPGALDLVLKLIGCIRRVQVEKLRRWAHGGEGAIDGGGL